MKIRKKVKKRITICEYSLCDREIKKGDEHITDSNGKDWCPQCYDLFLYRDMASYHGYEIEKRIKELEPYRVIKIKGETK